MANENEVWIKLMGDINDINQKLNQLQMNSNSVSQKMSTNWLSTAKGIGAALGVAFSARAIVNFGKQAVNTFQEAELSSVRFTNALQNIGVSSQGIKSIEDIVNSLSKLTYFKPEEIKTAFQDLVIRFGNAQVALKALPVVLEAARAKGMDLSTTVNKLALGIQGALSGNVLGAARGLKEFGVNVTKGKDALQILDEVYKRIKGSAEGYNSVVGGTESLSLSYHNLKEVIGSQLSPAVQGLSAGLSKQLEITMANAAGSQVLKTGWENVGEFFGAVLGTVINLGSALIDLGGVISSIGDISYSGQQKRSAFTKDLANIKDNWAALKNSGATYDFQAGMNDVKNAINQTADTLGGLNTGLDATAQAASTFKAAWSAINIQGGNIPELAKFVGNLNMKPTIKKTLDVNVNINDKSQVPTATSKAVVSALSRRLKAEIAYESHGTGTYGGF